MQCKAQCKDARETSIGALILGQALLLPFVNEHVSLLRDAVHVEVRGVVAHTVAPAIKHDIVHHTSRSRSGRSSTKHQRVEQRQCARSMRSLYLGVKPSLAKYPSTLSRLPRNTVRPPGARNSTWLFMLVKLGLVVVRVGDA